MNPFDVAWQLLKANPSWMRSDYNRYINQAIAEGRYGKEILPNPFDPNYQEELEEQKRQRAKKMRQNELRIKATDNLLNARRQMYMKNPNIREAPAFPSEIPEEYTPPTLDEEYEKYYSQ